MLSTQFFSERGIRVQLTMLYEKTNYDKWFLYNIAVYCTDRNTNSKRGLFLTKLLMDAKQNGFSDKRISAITGMGIR